MVLCRDGRAKLDKQTVWAAHVGHDLAPGFGDWPSQLGGACSQCLGVGGGHVVGDEPDLKAQWLSRGMGGHMTAGEVGVAQLVRGEGQWSWS